MSGESLKKQALLTAGGGALTRAMGFGLRLFLSRMLGAEALGIMELASGAHMLALTPGTAGLPGAVSRLTARADTPQKRRLTLYAARRTALKTGLILAPLFFLLSPMIARLLGDERALPSLWLFSPCVLFAGLSAVYDGAFFGRGRVLPPAVRQLTEQAVRLAAVAGLAFLAPRLTAAYRDRVDVCTLWRRVRTGLCRQHDVAGTVGMTLRIRDDRVEIAVQDCTAFVVVLTRLTFLQDIVLVPLISHELHLLGHLGLLSTNTTRSYLL